VEVGKKGYVIIPKNIRDLLGIKEGDKLTLNVYDGKIILELKGRLTSMRS
jgi:transcriptional regulator, AbrB family